MAEVYIKGGLTQENAILLLAAAEELGEDPSLVRTTLKGFVTTKKIAKAAGVESYDPDAEFNAEIAKAEKAVEAKPEPQDGVIPAGEAPPVLDDEGNLVVEAEPTDAEPDSEITDDGVIQKVDDAPAQSDNKAAWVEYAKAKGETDESLTKAQLIEKYGTKE